MVKMTDGCETSPFDVASLFWLIVVDRRKSRNSTPAPGSEKAIVGRFYMAVALASWLYLLAPFSSTAYAADLRMVGNASGSYRELVIEGIIESGDYEKFIRLIRDNQGKISNVWIFTPGGDFAEAMKIGRAMRALELSSMVPMRDASGRPVCDGQFGMPTPKDQRNGTCASAGFFIHIGSVHRGGTYMAVHRPYFDKAQFSQLSEDQAKKNFEALQEMAREYMTEMGVPKYIQEDVLGTSSDRALVLDEKIVKTYFWGYLPSRHEWLKAKCSRLTEVESVRLGHLRQKLLKSRGANAGLSPDEMSEYQDLKIKEDEERDAEIALIEKSRLAAYEKFFGSKPSDHTTHNFAKWVEAANYLGRSFDEILAEERFEESKQPIWNNVHRYYLTRKATSNAPYASMHDASSDSKSNIRIAVSVSVLSPPNPSDEFIEKLSKTLDDAWGKHVAGESSKERVWEQDSFKAILKYRGQAADGAYRVLDIDSKRK